MSNAEINNIEDIAVRGLIIGTASQCDTPEKFIEKLKEGFAIANSSLSTPQGAMAEIAPIEMPNEASLRALYEYVRSEINIVHEATAMLKQEQPSVNPNRIPPKKAWDINDIGQKLADGPGLTILDGGPGAGKSFSLGKAVDVMQVPVICLGATESAAATLYNDMKKNQADHAKDAAKGKDVPPSVSILGGLTVDQLLCDKEELSKDPETDEKGNVIPSPYDRRNALEEALNGTTKPCIMVDEAGLLNHDQMKGLMDYFKGMGVKMILAGDSQQIPPEKGQPFKMLAESLKETNAYVNAPYVFRQSDFVEKAITSGIYHGKCSDKMEISLEMASEFMVAAFDVGEPKFKGRTYTKEVKKEDGTITTEQKDFTFDRYLKEKYPDHYLKGKYPKEEYPDYYDEKGVLKKEVAVKEYVKELSDKAQEFFAGDKTAMLKALEDGPRTVQNPDGSYDNSQYDRYVCAALMCQTMGISAYDLRGQIKGKDPAASDIYDDVATDFAANYQKSLTDGLKKRQDKAEKDKKDPSGLTLDYADGMLAITATPDEAKELNNAIRRKLYNIKDTEQLPPLKEGEPIILKDGSRVLATAEHADNPPEGFKYAYALDVKTTQGMSQVGKVTFVVRPETQHLMRGGEILVGATRHKGDFEIKLAPGVNKDDFYTASTKQFASARVFSDTFQEDLFRAAKEQENVSEKEIQKLISERYAEASKDQTDIIQQANAETSKKTSRKSVNFKMNKLYTQAAQGNPQAASLTAKISAFSDNNNKNLNDKIIQKKIENGYGK